MKPDRSTVRIVGETLYGELWQSPLARDLPVAVRTMQRWVSGDFEIPRGVWAELASLCQARGAKLIDLSLELRKLSE
jgi:hypothetical protein